MSAGRYFTRRAPTRPPDFEDEYWHFVKDPDGCQRDRLAERDLHLADLSEELAFVRGLPVGRVLDVGCGLGFFLSGLDPAWLRHGVEISAFAAKHAARWADVHVGTLQSARYPDGWFDLVILHHVIEHVEDPVALVSEVSRVLKPGGALVLGTPDFAGACARRFGDNYRLLHDATHVSLFSADGMHRFLRDQGLLIQNVAFPFFETRHFTEGNLLRMFDTSRTSPPFHGNFMTYYCVKPRLHRLTAALQCLGAVTVADVRQAEAEGTAALQWLQRVRDTAAPIEVESVSTNFSDFVASLILEGLGAGRSRSATRCSLSDDSALILRSSADAVAGALEIAEEGSRQASLRLSFPRRCGGSRQSAQLLLVEALLSELAAAT